MLIGIGFVHTVVRVVYVVSSSYVIARVIARVVHIAWCFTSYAGFRLYGAPSGLHRADFMCD